MTRARALALAAAVGLAAGSAIGCPGASSRSSVTPSDKPSRDDETRLAHMYSELEDDIFTSYERDEPPDLGTRAIDRRIGAARIGAGPGDVYIAGDLARAPSRWPLDIDRSTRTEVRSKHLAMQIALDQTAGWMSDEVSWRIEMCGRSAVIPLRITALYAQDGDRWVPVVEHLSFGFPPLPIATTPPRPIRAEVVSGRLRDQLQDVLVRGLFRTPHDPAALAAQGIAAVVLGPDMADEWHGERVPDARLPAGAFADPRVGVIGGTPDTATVAYWIGNYAANPGSAGSAAGSTVRVTHVFEKRWFEAPGGPSAASKSCHLEDRDLRDRTDKARDVAAHCRWVVVQSHMSLPISDDELTRLVFGTALVSPKPLQLDCSDGSQPLLLPMAPGAGLRPGASQPGRPAAGTR